MLIVITIGSNVKRSDFTISFHHSFKCWDELVEHTMHSRKCLACQYVQKSNRYTSQLYISCSNSSTTYHRPLEPEMLISCPYSTTLATHRTMNKTSNRDILLLGTHTDSTIFGPLQLAITEVMSGGKGSILWRNAPWIYRLRGSSPKYMPPSWLQRPHPNKTVHIHGCLPSKPLDMTTWPGCMQNTSTHS